MAFLAALLPALVTQAGAETWTHPIAAALCASLAQAADAREGGPAPGFLVSYEAGADERALPPSLAASAFVYDNALASIAFVACGDLPHAARIGSALGMASRRDRTFRDGRIRNAYRAGSLREETPLLPGWWDEQSKIWAEDPYQDGTATGNVAWAALALLTLHEATRDAQYLADADRLVGWIAANTASGPAGFEGGVYGYDPQQTRLRWKSTEHNVDILAVAAWLFRLTGDQKYAAVSAQSRRLLDQAFQPDGHFLLGTRSDGTPADPAQSALDAQIWPSMAVSDAPEEWRLALDFAERHLAVDGGFDFNADRDGVWVEGTAQAALAYRMAGNRERSEQLLNGLWADRARSGLLNATRVPRLTTGLAIAPDSKTADLFYFRRPHLGATAWGVLAAKGWNPFTGTHVR